MPDTRRVAIFDVAEVTTEPAPIPRPPRSLWQDAWDDLRRNPIFIVSALLIAFLILIAAWPSLIASGDPLHCDLARSQQGPVAGHPFGFDTQGCDVYTRTVYGARASVTVGICATAGAATLGSLLGGLAGFFGGWWDGLLSRITDVFFGIPLLLAAIVLMQVTRHRTVWTVIAFLALFGWPQIARIARGAVLEVRARNP